jgi:hypothetical protein
VGASVRSILIDSGQKFVQPVEVAGAGTLVKWAYGLNMDGDSGELQVGFQVLFRPATKTKGRGAVIFGISVGVAAAREVVKYRRRALPKWPQCLQGEWTSTGPGELTIAWDNSFSWIKSKALNIRVDKVGSNGSLDGSRNGSLDGSP